jgi:hypothetical protein
LEKLRSVFDWSGVKHIDSAPEGRSLKHTMNHTPLT